MMIRCTYQLLFFAAALLCSLALARPARADFIVSVNTSSISGTQGFIDIQFDPGSNSPAATATVTNFSTDATMESSVNGVPPGIDGDASGTLPATLTIHNTDVLNDVYQPVTYGSYIRFDVGLSGSAAGSSFSLSLYASDFATPLLVDNNSSDAAYSPNGAIVTITPNSDGSVTIETFSDPNNPNFDPNNPNGPSDGAAIATPEPSTLLLSGVSLASLGLAAGYKRLRRRGESDPPSPNLRTKHATQTPQERFERSTCHDADSPWKTASESIEAVREPFFSRP